YLQLIIRYKWRLIAAGMLGLFLGHLAYLRSGPDYDAFAQILVKRMYTPPIREEDRLLTAQTKPTDHIPLLTSPMLIEKAIELGSLKNLPTFRGATDLVEDVQDSLKVKRVAGNDRSSQTVLEIRFASPRPADSRKVVEAIIAAYELHLQQDSKEQSTEVLRLAKEKSIEISNALEAKQESHRQFLLTVPEEFRATLGPKTLATQSTNISPEDVIHALGEDRNRNRVRLADLISRQSALQNAIDLGESREALEVRIRRFLHADGGGSQEAERQTQISVYQSQLMPLIIKERELSRDFGRDHPELISTRQSIKKILETYAKLGLKFPEGEQSEKFERDKVLLSDFVTLYLDSLRHQIEEHQIKEKELSKMIQKEGNRANEFFGYQDIDQRMRDTIDGLRSVLEKQLDRESGVAIEKDTNGYRMLTLAPVKHELVIKKLIKFYMGGAVCVAFLAALTCLIQELRDLRFKSTRDVRVDLRQPILGGVASFHEPVGATPLASGLHPALRYLVAPNSIEAENFRQIRTALLVTADQQRARSILVSSPEPGDGKTTLVSNLAVALAQSGKRVLLIDADLRRPSIHKVFSVAQDIGLTDVLMGEIEMLNAIRKTNIDRLSLLTSGQIPTNPAELLSSVKLSQILHNAKDEFDFVLIDT
ncbi:MAG: polysaccharide biosynthesis tyrosine autokinase, partial [Planctomycetes bacterium]|nr:polysaccharide biosynthesis tyrosine autokinase [Planctomycetota bacterium]